MDPGHLNLPKILQEPRGYSDGAEQSISAAWLDDQVQRRRMGARTTIAVIVAWLIERNRHRPLILLPYGVLLFTGGLFLPASWLPVYRCNRGTLLNSIVQYSI